MAAKIKTGIFIFILGCFSVSFFGGMVPLSGLPSRSKITKPIDLPLNVIRGSSF